MAILRLNSGGARQNGKTWQGKASYRERISLIVCDVMPQQSHAIMKLYHMRIKRAGGSQIQLGSPGMIWNDSLKCAGGCPVFFANHAWKFDT